MLQIASDAFRLAVGRPDSKAPDKPFTSRTIDLHEQVFKRIQLPTQEAVALAMKMRSELRAVLDDLLDDTSLLLMPILPTAHASYNGEVIWKRYNMLYAQVATLTGFPSLAVPLWMGGGRGGAKEGHASAGEQSMPMSIQLVGRPYSERLLFAAAK
jgi:Asp-tRNA(Asn)/Glu-tRNA(Gln) amidotransferase A subunit family amidase